MKPESVLRHIALTVLATAFVLPLVWLIAGSLRTPGLPPPRAVEWLPDPLTWSNYARIFDLAPLGRQTLNSLIVVALAMPVTVVIASWTGFALAQLPREDRTPLIRMSIVLLMIPFTAVWLGRFLIFSQLSLVNTVWALVAPAFMGTSPFFALLFYWTFRRLSSEVYESARLDGAGALTVWWRVALPQAAPTAIGVAVLTCVVYWSDFISPLLYIKSPESYTLPIGLQLLQQMDRTNFPLLLAASVVMIVPLLVLYALLQIVIARASRPNR